MLRNRTVQTRVGNSAAEAVVTKGCPHGGVLSSLLWCLVVDSLLHKLSDSGIYVQTYAVILITGKFGDTLSDLMRLTLKTVEA